MQTFTFYIKQDVIDELRKIKHKTGSSMGELIRQAIVEFLESKQIN